MRRLNNPWEWFLIDWDDAPTKGVLHFKFKGLYRWAWSRSGVGGLIPVWYFVRVIKHSGMDSG